VKWSSGQGREKRKTLCKGGEREIQLKTKGWVSRFRDTGAGAVSESIPQQKKREELVKKKNLKKENTEILRHRNRGLAGVSSATQAVFGKRSRLTTMKKRKEEPVLQTSAEPQGKEKRLPEKRGKRGNPNLK